MPAKILVVDDHPDSREMLTTILEGEGFSVVTAEDGQVAITLLETDRPDLIVTDIEMPNSDGIALIKRLRQRDEWSGLPVLVLSADGSVNISEALRSGANWALHKPAQFEALVILIKGLLSGTSSLIKETRPASAKRG